MEELLNYINITTAETQHNQLKSRASANAKRQTRTTETQNFLRYITMLEYWKLRAF